MFQKFMGNKDFHPATYQNLKKVTIEGSAHKARFAEERSSCGRCHGGSTVLVHTSLTLILPACIAVAMHAQW